MEKCPVWFTGRTWHCLVKASLASPVMDVHCAVPAAGSHRDLAVYGSADLAALFPGQDLPPSCREAVGGCGTASWPPHCTVMSSTALAHLGLSMAAWPATCAEVRAAVLSRLKSEQKPVRECFVWMWIKLFHD